MYEIQYQPGGEARLRQGERIIVATDPGIVTGLSYMSAVSPYTLLATGLVTLEVSDYSRSGKLVSDFSNMLRPFSLEALTYEEYSKNLTPDDKMVQGVILALQTVATTVFNPAIPFIPRPTSAKSEYFKRKARIVVPKWSNGRRRHAIDATAHAYAYLQK